MTTPINKIKQNCKSFVNEDLKGKGKVSQQVLINLIQKKFGYTKATVKEYLRALNDEGYLELDTNYPYAIVYKIKRSVK